MLQPLLYLLVSVVSFPTSRRIYAFWKSMHPRLVLKQTVSWITGASLLDPWVYSSSGVAFSAQYCKERQDQIQRVVSHNSKQEEIRILLKIMVQHMSKKWDSKFPHIAHQNLKTQAGLLKERWSISSLKMGLTCCHTTQL